MRSFGSAPREVYYVAQENIEPLDRRESVVVNNAQTLRFFKEYDIFSGSFVPKEKFLFPYSLTGPDDASGGNGSAADKEREEDYRVIEQVLLRTYGQLEGALVSGNVGSNPRVDAVEEFRNSVVRKAKRKQSLGGPKKFTLPPPTATTSAPADAEFEDVANTVWLRNGDLLTLLQAAPSRQAAHMIENMKWVCWMTNYHRLYARYMREGVSMLARGCSKEALDLFHGAMVLRPDEAETYNKISAISYVRQEFSGAIMNANLALKFDSKHYAASAMLGLSLLKTNRKQRTTIIDDIISVLTLDCFLRLLCCRYGQQKTKGRASGIRACSALQPLARSCC
jgi:tetratricopeptide (TPR) repeat protein